MGRKILRFSWDSAYLLFFNHSKFFCFGSLFICISWWNHSRFTNCNKISNLFFFKVIGWIYFIYLWLSFKVNVFFLSKISHSLAIITKCLKMLNLSLDMVRVTHRWSWVFNKLYIFLTYFWFSIKLYCFYKFEVNMTFVLEIYVLSGFSS